MLRAFVWGLGVYFVGMGFGLLLARVFSHASPMGSLLGLVLGMLLKSIWIIVMLVILLKKTFYAPGLFLGLLVAVGIQTLYYSSLERNVDE
jgi:hypothetical protein